MTGRTARGNPVPAPCDAKVFKHGKSIAWLDAASEDAEAFVQDVKRHSGQRVDWHYSGGIAQVLYIGDHDLVAASINDVLPSHPGVRLMRLVEPDGPALYRHGDAVPDGTIGGTLLFGEPAFIIGASKPRGLLARVADFIRGAW